MKTLFTVHSAAATAAELRIARRHADAWSDSEDDDSGGDPGNGTSSASGAGAGARALATSASTADTASDRRKSRPTFPALPEIRHEVSEYYALLRADRKAEKRRRAEKGSGAAGEVHDGSGGSLGSVGGAEQRGLGERSSSGVGAGSPGSERAESMEATRGSAMAHAIPDRRADSRRSPHPSARPSLHVEALARPARVPKGKFVIPEIYLDPLTASRGANR